MAEITPERINITAEAVAYARSVAESILSDVGASINFINNRQYDSKAFFLNGPYGEYSGAQTGVDGAFPILFDMEIIGISMFNLVPGSSGVTTLDVRRFTASNTPAGGASIFSTKPSIDSTAPANAFVTIRTIPTLTTLEQATGATVPVLQTVNLDAGDMITLNIDNKQVGGQNCGLIVYFRPR